MSPPETEILRPEAVFRVSPAVRFRILDDEGVVIHQQAGEVLVVNEVGARILQLLDGERSVAALVAILEEEWQAPRERLARDAEEYLQQLAAAAIIEAIPAADRLTPG